MVGSSLTDRPTDLCLCAPRRKGSKRLVSGDVAVHTVVMVVALVGFVNIDCGGVPRNVVGPMRFARTALFGLVEREMLKRKVR